MEESNEVESQATTRVKKEQGEITKRSRDYKSYLIAAVILLLSIVIAALILYFQPIPDSVILKNANPAMLALAQQAGMNKQGELVFLRTNPLFATDTQMRTYCANNAAANNNNGFIEQGCFVPNIHNHANGRIYIRQMPANLYDQEIVTATYEMLHSVYFSLSDNGQNTFLVQAIEGSYNSLHNPALDAQVVNFANTEPGYRDLELFSLLGTEFNNVTPSLENFYTPYFANRQLTVDSYNRVTAIFQNDQTQLQQLRTTIASDDSLANKAYADSLAWAQQGNVYEDTYNYNIYKNYINQENAAINQYNQLSNAYNTLVTEYNGSQPINSLQNIQTQSSK